MNKAYLSEVYHKHVNREVTTNMLKFYQLTTRIPEFFKECTEDNGKYVKDIDTKYFDIPESIIESVPFTEVDKMELLIINAIEDFMKLEDNIFILPIFTIYKSKKLDSGHYGIDYMNNRLVKYKNITKLNFDLETEVSNKICISYFIDIYKCAYLYEERGFVEAILQIGRLLKQLENEAINQDFSVKVKGEAEQVFTHEVGLNCREQLFIKNQFFSIGV